MLRALFTAAKAFVVVKAVDAVIGAIAGPRTPRRASAKSKPHRASKRRSAHA